jgi:hypothetical protein
MVVKDERKLYGPVIVADESDVNASTSSGFKAKFLGAR